MFNIIRTALGSAVFCLFCGELPAADYYIDFAQGSDVRTGTTPAEAWKHCPGDGEATGVAAAAVLAPGDAVLFKAGTTYLTSGIGLSWSGTEGQEIVYDGAAWGEGERCIITTENLADSVAMTFNVDRREFVTIQRLHFKDIGGYAEDDPIWTEPVDGWNESRDAVSNPSSGTALNLAYGKKLVISDCKFERVGQWRNWKPMSGTGSVSGAGITLQNNTDCMILNCEFTCMKTGVSIKSRDGTISGITVKGCSFHNSMNWLIDMAPRSSGSVLQDITIEDNMLYNYKEFDRPNWMGWGDKPHQDGIFIRASGMASTWTNIVIRGNRFYSDDDSNGGTASIYVSQGPSVLICNNVFLNDHQANAAVKVGYGNVTGTTQTVRVLNNTFVSGSRPIQVSSSEGTNPDVLDVRNNLIFRRVTGSNDCVTMSAAGDIGTLIMDYNFYCTLRDPLSLSTVVYDGAYRTFAQWQAGGYEAHGRLVDPELMSLSGVPSTWDVRPSGTSPLIDAGADLSAYLTTDKDGNPRTGSFDVGAYEYQGSGPGGDVVPAAPQSVSALAVSDTLIEVMWSDVSVNEEDFEIQYSLASDSGFGVAGTAPAGEEQFTIGGLAAGTAYFVRVRARNQAGFSAYSSVAGATTPAMAVVSEVGAVVGVADATVIEPFVELDGVVSQDVETVDLHGGRAGFLFNVAEQGDYAVGVLVDAPGEGSNSLFVDMDREPSVPASAWHISVTSGFQWQPVSWQGNGTVAEPELAPKFFTLGPGVHELVIRGREKGTKFKSVVLQKKLGKPPSGATPP